MNDEMNTAPMGDEENTDATPAMPADDAPATDGDDANTDADTGSDAPAEEAAPEAAPEAPAEEAAPEAAPEAGDSEESAM